MIKSYLWIGLGIAFLFAIGIFIWSKMRKKDSPKVANPSSDRPKPILYFDDDLGQFIRMKFIDSNKKTYSFSVFRGVNLPNMLVPPYRVDVTSAGKKATITIHQNADLVLSAVLDTVTYDIQLL